MLLKRLKLQNFRSYGDEPTVVEFGQGLLLFEGEIGSGKSSILYAVEFALFGLGELDSKFLIRSSASSARVELEFEVAGREYKVTRTIEKKKGSRGRQIQTKGWIEEPDGKETEYPPTELRSRILQILNFREKQGSKASSRIYRFAIFTPQELMKEVLSQSAEERIDTLRRAFGVEDYSFAISNTDLVVKRLNDQSKIYRKLSEGVEEAQSSLVETRGSLSSNQQSLAEERTKLAEFDDRISESRSSIEKLELESKKVAQLETLIPELERGLRASQSRLLEAKKELEKQAQFLREVETAERKLSILRFEYENYAKYRETLRELEGLRQEMFSIQNRISALEASISSNEKSIKEQIESLKGEQSTLSERVSSYSEHELSVSALEQSAKALKEKIAELPRVQSEISEASSEMRALSAMLDSRESEQGQTKEKLGRLGDLAGESLCPLCGQRLDPQHLEKVRGEFEQSIDLLDREIGESRRKIALLREKARKLEDQNEKLLEAQRRFEEIEGEISESRQILRLKEEAMQHLEQLRMQTAKLVSKLERREFALEEMGELREAVARKETLSKPLSEYSKLEAFIRKFEDSGMLKSFQSAEMTASRKQDAINAISALNDKLALLEREVSQRASELEDKRKELEESQPAMLRFAKAKRELDGLQDLRSEIKESIAGLSERTTSESKEIQRLEDEIKKFRESEAKASVYKGVSNWLEEHFLPAVSEIESYVFASINEDFNELLRRFFSILVEEGELTATIDDNFSPVIEQGGYELDVQSLSGGERTAVALAYRLALNYMVKRANEAMQANLLILDEPTEGFSKEQIYRLRNVLEELDCEQVIIVSHERDLEAMVNRVYRVEKINGVSVVSVAS